MPRTLSVLSMVLLAMLCLGLPATPAFAQAGLAGEPVATCIARAESGMTPQELFREPAHFDCATNQTAFGAGDFWVRSARLRRDGPLEIRWPSLWQERVALYALYGDGAIVSVALDQQAVSRHLALGAIIAQPLEARAAPLVRLLWRVEHAANLRGILREPRIATPAQSVTSNLTMAALYGGFGGLCIALITYHLALWATLRHRFQLAYCAMVLALLGYAMSSSGALVWLWPTIANTDRMRVNYLTLGVSAVAALAFARSFFEPRVFAGGLARLFNVASGAMLAATLAYTLIGSLDVRLFDRLYALAFAGLLLVVIPMLWRAWVTRSNYLWLFALTWGAPIVVACFRVASGLSLIHWNFWLDNSTAVTMTLEALLSSLAIAYRVRVLSRERDAAREGEVAALLLAETDPLTGLLNRRAFLSAAIGREGEQLLLIVDLDHFKLINETIGHDGGDEVLRAVARTLQLSVPEAALVARIGGEEFAIVLPAEAAVEPRDILDRLRAARMPYDVSVTASIGKCIGPLKREVDWKALYAAADRALFDAKSAGRDRARMRSLSDRAAA
ncbi:GGDEF domain-containing protein [Sphingomonas sp. PAMC 26605]|uniref:GGDEF domain-containing protein n=1 Tax=Sphingomonas sp. PAMC 26605 TaxID=1112214 RepID=UPI000495D324|nr:diguanylate cyclase [Sphingomonas sp. PAMC 26605]